MDLTYSQEQNMLKDSVVRFVADAYGARDKAADFDRAVWKQFAELGWLSLTAPESAGGFGGGAVDAGLVMEAFGAGLVTEPYGLQAGLATDLLARLGDEAQQQDHLAALMAGERLFALALEEGRRFSLDKIATTAARDGASWLLNGAKPFALNAGEADFVIVAARDGADLALFVAPRGAPGLGLETFPMLGGGSAARLTLKDVRLGADARLGAGDARPALEAAIDKTIALMCCEALGMMQALVEKTAAYAKTRVQFNAPLAANQVVRHRLADMVIATEETRSLSLRACLLADAAAPERMRAVSGAKAKISRHLRFVCEQAVQLHGGMGVTEELDIGRYLKRAMAFEALFGDAQTHLVRRASALMAA